MGKTYSTALKCNFVEPPPPLHKAGFGVRGSRRELQLSIVFLFTSNLLDRYSIYEYIVQNQILIKMKRLLTVAIFLITIQSCSTNPESKNSKIEPVLQGKFIEKGKADHFVFSNTPELSVDIIVDSVSTGATNYAMGIGYLNEGSNYGTHEDFDEIIFIHLGDGKVVVNSDTFPGVPGNTFFIPKGTYHGFINKHDSLEMQFVWYISPNPNFTNGIRN